MRDNNMVTFQLLHKSEKEIRYEYFPEGDVNSMAGLIGINLENDEIMVLQPAELDVLITVSGDSMKAMRDSINEMRSELGEPLLTEEELPMTKADSSYYCYASRAVQKIEKDYRRGIILQEGNVIWY